MYRECFGIDGEEAHRGPVFGRHVGHGGPVGEAHLLQAGAEVFDELADHAMRPQHLRDGQHQVGRGGSFGEFSGEFEADDFRRQHVDRLAEHDRFGFDAAHAPTDDAQAVDHRGVAVGADEAVGEGNAVAGEHDLGEVFQIHLMHDAGRRRDHAEVVKRLLAPAQELVPFLIPLEFALDVVFQGEATCRTRRPARSGR